MNMKDITTEQLATINLRYGTTAKSLKALAYADLTAKALFLSDKPATISELANIVAELIGISKLSEDFIGQGLEELEKDGKVKRYKNKWELSDADKEKTKNELQASDKFLDGVLSRHFPKSIRADLLKSWFIKAASDFFKHNGEEWVKSVCKNVKDGYIKPKTTEELLSDSLKEFGLKGNKQELEDGFEAFIISDNPDDQRYLYNLGSAMFSARLVAADVGTEPIIIDELKGATFYLDTNFLFALVLEKNRFVTALEALGRALETIGANLVYIYETGEEYKRVLTGKRGEIVKLVEVYPEEVVESADDDFISTAKKRGCAGKDDFETFFDALRNIPSSVPEGPIISLKDNDEIKKVVQDAEKDEKLKKSIQDYRLKLRPFWDKIPKSKSALKHDAALVSLVEKTRKDGENSFILTLDRSLQVCSAERSGPHGLPTALHLDGLIHILAANNAGAGLDASDFAPLLANIIAKKCMPLEHTYVPQDLHWLYGIQKNVTSFSPTKIKEIVMIVMRARLSGKTADDAQLQRAVHRLYQEEILNIDTELDISRDTANSERQRAEREKGLRIGREEELVYLKTIDIKRKAVKKLFWELLWRLPVALLISIVVFLLSSWGLEVIGRGDALSYVVSVATVITMIYKLVKSPFANFKKERRNAENEARQSL
jgi:hypothetical protein